MPPTRALYRTVRSWHLYAGLFISPLVLVYAISALSLNHAYLPWGGGDAEPAVRQTQVAIPADTSGLAIAKSVRTQLGLSGEIGYVSQETRERRLAFPIETPGGTTRVRVDLATGLARLSTTRSGVWAAMIYLHKMPGPHNVAIRGNWPVTKAWGWVADANVYLLLFVSSSGLYLWAVVRAERRAGLAFLGAGILSFALLVMGLVA